MVEEFVWIHGAAMSSVSFKEIEDQEHVASLVCVMFG